MTVKLLIMYVSIFDFLYLNISHFVLSALNWCTLYIL